MSMIILQDSSFWITVSFVLLFLVLGKRFFKHCIDQLNSREKTIERQISEVATLYEEARQLLRDEKNALAQTEEELCLQKKELLQEIESQTNRTQKMLETLLQKNTQAIAHKTQMLEDLAILALKKRILHAYCQQATLLLKKNMRDQKQMSTVLVEKALTMLEP